MKLRVLPQVFAVCKVDDLSGVKYDDKFLFIGKTDEEVSLVCEEGSVPPNVTMCEKDWKVIGIAEILDFSLTGIIAEISKILSEARIGIFVVSTYNTDYILVKSQYIGRAIITLSANGYTFL